MRAGDLVWAPYRSKLLPGVVVKTGRARYRVHLPGANATTWIGRGHVMLRDEASRTPLEDLQRALDVTGAAAEVHRAVAAERREGNEPSDDPRPLKSGSGRLGDPF